jgi:hypothetical protein
MTNEEYLEQMTNANQAFLQQAKDVLVEVNKSSADSGLRDWFAGLAMQALIPKFGYTDEGADRAYMWADAMMKRRTSEDESID